MTDRDALLAAIASHPDEDTPRLMYADEISEDCPERAAYITASVRHAQHYGLRSLAKEAAESRKDLADLLSRWIPSLWPIPVCPSDDVKCKFTWLSDTNEGFAMHGNSEFPGHRADYRRGFCWQLVIRHVEWLRWADAILAIEPLICSVIFTTRIPGGASSFSERWPQIGFRTGAA
jgi:uncharacterized protein (TIGR02996 family)